MCLDSDEKGGPCRCPADSRARAEAAEAAADDADREVMRLRRQLDELPDTLDTLLTERPDLAVTIRKLHAAGFDMTVSGRLRDAQNKPMLIVGDRHPDRAHITTPDAAGADGGGEPTAADRPAVKRPTPAERSTTSSRRPRQQPSAVATPLPATRANRYPDPKTYRRNSPERKLQEMVDREGGTWMFMALFDLNGNPVPARRVDTPWGLKWAVYDNHELRGKASRWVQVAGGDHRTRIAKLEGQGYRLGRVRVKAQAVPVGEGANRSAEIVRLDSGYDPHAQVVTTFDEEFYDY